MQKQGNETTTTSEDAIEQSEWGEWDVPLGRSQDVREFIGNLRYRLLVEQHRPAYLAATRRAEKTSISNTIFAAIRSRGGRFLDKDNENSCSSRSSPAKWYPISQEKALAKISQALRIGTGKQPVAPHLQNEERTLLASVGGAEQQHQQQLQHHDQYYLTEYSRDPMSPTPPGAYPPYPVEVHSVPGACSSWQSHPSRYPPDQVVMTVSTTSDESRPSPLRTEEGDEEASGSDAAWQQHHHRLPPSRATSGEDSAEEEYYQFHRFSSSSSSLPIRPPDFFTSMRRDFPRRHEDFLVQHRPPNQQQWSVSDSEQCGTKRRRHHHQLGGADAGRLDLVRHRSCDEVFPHADAFSGESKTSSSDFDDDNHYGEDPHQHHGFSSFTSLPARSDPMLFRRHHHHYHRYDCYSASSGDERTTMTTPTTMGGATNTTVRRTTSSRRGRRRIRHPHRRHHSHEFNDHDHDAVQYSYSFSHTGEYSHDPSSFDFDFDAVVDATALDDRVGVGDDLLVLPPEFLGNAAARGDYPLERLILDNNIDAAAAIAGGLDLDALLSGEFGIVEQPGAANAVAITAPLPAAAYADMRKRGHCPHSSADGKMEESP